MFHVPRRVTFGGASQDSQDADDIDEERLSDDDHGHEKGGGGDEREDAAPMDVGERDGMHDADGGGGGGGEDRKATRVLTTPLAQWQG